MVWNVVEGMGSSWQVKTAGSLLYKTKKRSVKETEGKDMTSVVTGLRMKTHEVFA